MILGSTNGFIKGDSRSFDYSSCGFQVIFRSRGRMGAAQSMGTMSVKIQLLDVDLPGARRDLSDS